MNAQGNVLLALTTCPSSEVATRIAQTLVSERLAACVNQMPGISSTYIWEGKVQTDTEVLLIIKTTEAQFAVIKERLAGLHPYELPELVAIPVCAGSERYLDWVRHNCAPK